MKKGKGLKTCLVVALILIFLAPYVSGAQERVITLNYSHIMPGAAKQAILSDQWCREVESRTSGRVKVHFHPGATLIPARQTYQEIVKGTADMGCTILGYTREKFPLMEAVDLPLGYRSGYVATKLINDFFKKFRPKELNDVKVLYLHAHGPGLLTARSRVEKLEDLRDMKIRAMGLGAKMVKALDASPVFLPIPQAYDALAKGTVEGILIPLEGLQQWRIAEVAQFTTESYGIAYSTGFAVVMNRKKWNSLPADIQRTIEAVSAEWIEKTATLWEEMDGEGRKFAEQAGMTFVPLSQEEERRWVDGVKPLLDDYSRNTRARNLPGEEALKFCLDYLAIR